MTIKELKADSIKKLLQKNVDISSANLDASILLAFTTGVRREFLLSHDDREVSAQQLENYNALFERRCAGEPIAYLIGEKEFYGIKFKVNSNVLIPRPETEELVELVVNSVDKSSTIIDIGTGSGCIAITLKHLVDSYSISAIDISDKAIDVAKENASFILKEGSEIDFINKDALSYTTDKKFDVIVSNPPYISYAEKSTMSIDVACYEPSLALFSGESGYEFYERIYTRLDVLLKSGGKFLFEIGYQQEGVLKEIFASKNVTFVKDMSGKSRFMVGSI